NANSGREARDDKYIAARRKRHRQGRQGEKACCQHQSRPAAILVSNLARYQATGDRTQGQASGSEAFPVRGERELFLKKGQRPGYYGKIKSEKITTECGDQGNAEYIQFIERGMAHIEVLVNSRSL